jgi:uncharacterized protein YdhG (YjbR/CyaY superfamily)
MSEQWIVNSDQTLKAYIKHVFEQYEKHGYLITTMKTGKTRTNVQNASLHLYCEMLASELNQHGFDMHKVLDNTIDIPWNQTLVKELMWKPVQLAMIDEESTTKANRKDYSEIYDVLNRHFSGKYGVHVPWPSKN